MCVLPWYLDQQKHERIHHCELWWISFKFPQLFDLHISDVTKGFINLTLLQPWGYFNVVIMIIIMWFSTSSFSGSSLSSSFRGSSPNCLLFPSRTSCTRAWLDLRATKSCLVTKHPPSPSIPLRRTHTVEVSHTYFLNCLRKIPMFIPLFESKMLICKQRKVICMLCVYSWSKHY